MSVESENPSVGGAASSRGWVKPVAWFFTGVGVLGAVGGFFLNEAAVAEKQEHETLVADLEQQILDRTAELAGGVGGAGLVTENLDGLLDGLGSDGEVVEGWLADIEQARTVAEQVAGLQNTMARLWVENPDYPDGRGPSGGPTIGHLATNSYRVELGQFFHESLHHLDVPELYEMAWDVGQERLDLNDMVDARTPWFLRYASQGIHVWRVLAVTKPDSTDFGLLDSGDDMVLVIWVGEDERTGGVLAFALGNWSISEQVFRGFALTVTAYGEQERRLGSEQRSIDDDRRWADYERNNQ